MFCLRLLYITMLCCSLGQSRPGTIISFEPPDPNDWVDQELIEETDVSAKHKDGRLVTNPKMDLYSMRLERYCVETFETPHITALQWYNPPKMKCSGGHYLIMKLQYDDYTIDCLRMNTASDYVLLASVKPYVIKRFFLKVYYLTTSGDCYVKYFELPYRQCTDDGHIKLPARMCKEHFPTNDHPFIADETDEVNVTVV